MGFALYAISFSISFINSGVFFPNSFIISLNLSISLFYFLMISVFELLLFCFFQITCSILLSHFSYCYTSVLCYWIVIFAFLSSASHTRFWLPLIDSTAVTMRFCAPRLLRVVSCWVELVLLYFVFIFFTY